MNAAPDGPDRTTTELIWRGVEEAPERVGAMQPPWPIDPLVAIKADVGHHHGVDDVVPLAVASVRAGACAVHLHVRDAEGRDSGDLGLWREVVGSIRATVGSEAVIDSGLRGRTLEERLAHLRAGLVNIVPLIPTWDPAYLAPLLGEMHGLSVRPELIVWDGTDITLAHAELLESGLVARPAAWLVVMSSPYYGMPAPSPALMSRGLLHLVDLIRAADPDAHICVSASGRASNYLVAQALTLGLHVRPGLGETHWRNPHREVSADTPTLVADAVTLARVLGREPMSAADYRAAVIGSAGPPIHPTSDAEKA